MDKPRFTWDEELLDWVPVPQNDDSVLRVPWYRRHTRKMKIAGLILVGIGLGLSPIAYFPPPLEWIIFTENRALHDLIDSAERQLDSFEERVEAIELRDHNLFSDLIDVGRNATGGNASSEFEFREATLKVVDRLNESVENLNVRVMIQESTPAELKAIAESRGVNFAQVPVSVPLATDNLRITSCYGNRIHPLHGGVRHHDGIDFSAPLGTPVLAAADGKVQIIHNQGKRTGYGLYITVVHPDVQYKTLYAHLTRINPELEAGMWISRGDTIAFSGNSGHSTGPHLHYEVHKVNHNSPSITIEDPIGFLSLGLEPTRLALIEGYIHCHRRSRQKS